MSDDARMNRVLGITQERQYEPGARVRLKKFAGRWLTYGEYMTVEFDTEAGTAVVVPSR